MTHTIKLNHFSIIFLIFFLFQSILSDEKIEDLSNLNLLDFNKKLEFNDFSLVLFYLKNDSEFDSKKLINTHETINQVLIKQYQKKTDLDDYTDFVKFYTVNCDTLTGLKLCKSYLISSSIKWKLFRFGLMLKDFSIKKVQDVSGKERDLLNWVKTNVKTISRRFNSIDELISFIKQIKLPLVIGLFKNSKDSLTLDFWINSISKVQTDWNYKDLSFCHLFQEYTNDDLNKLFSFLNVSSINIPSLILFRQENMIHKKEKRFIVYEFQNNKEDLSNWIQRKIFGLIYWRSKKNDKFIEFPLVVAFLDFDFKNNFLISSKWRNEVYEIALNNLDINFALSNSNDYKKFIDKIELKLPKDGSPLFIAYDIFGYNYAFKDTYSFKNFKNFLNKFRHGKIKPNVIKSEISFNENNDHIIETTSYTFPKFVTYNEKDVLLAFYSKKCKFSQTMIENIEELKKQLVEKDRIDIVKFEVNKNDVPPKFIVKKTPTFYFVKSKTKKLISYDIRNDIHSLIRFVAKHSTKELTKFDRLGSIKEKIEKKYEL